MSPIICIWDCKKFGDNEMRSKVCGNSIGLTCTETVPRPALVEVGKNVPQELHMSKLMTAIAALATQDKLSLVHLCQS